MYPSRNIGLPRVSLWFREIIVIVVSMTVPKYRSVQGRAQKVFLYMIYTRVNLLRAKYIVENERRGLV